MLLGGLNEVIRCHVYFVTPGLLFTMRRETCICVELDASEYLDRG